MNSFLMGEEEKERKERKGKYIIQFYSKETKKAR